MGVNILQVLWLGAVDIARDVQVEIIFRIADLGQWHHPRIARDFNMAGKYVYNFMDVLGAEAVLVAIFEKALGGIDHEDAFSGCGIFLVENDDAGGNARAIKEIRRQPDNAFDKTTADYFPSDSSFGIATEKHAMGQNDRSFPCALQGCKDMQEESVIPVLVRRDTVIKALELVLLRVEAVASSFSGKGWIGYDKVECLEAAVGVFVMRTGKGVILPYFRRRTIVQNHVHFR